MNGDPDYDGPPIEYDADWIPVCCGRQPAAHVAAGAYPQATVTQFVNTRGTVTVGARPEAIIRQRHRTAGRVTAGARPASVLSPVPPIVIRVAAGARPAALVEVIHQLVNVQAGARPEAIIRQTFRPPAEVTAGAYPEALILPSSCVYAWALAAGEECPIPLDVNPGGYWFYIGILTGGNVYHIEHLTIGGFGFNIAIESGPSCASLTPITPTYPAPACIQWTQPGTQHTWIRCETDHLIPQPETFKWDTGPC